MNASFSKESLSSWIQQDISTPTRSGPLSPSRSELWTKIGTSCSSVTGSHVSLNELQNGEVQLSQRSEVKSASSSSLSSKVAPEKIIESLPPQRKILTISRADVSYLGKILENYKKQIEKVAKEL